MPGGCSGPVPRPNSAPASTTAQTGSSTRPKLGAKQPRSDATNSWNRPPTNAFTGDCVVVGVQYCSANSARTHGCTYARPNVSNALAAGSAKKPGPAPSWITSARSGRRRGATNDVGVGSRPGSGAALGSAAGSSAGTGTGSGSGCGVGPGSGAGSVSTSASAARGSIASASTSATMRASSSQPAASMRREPSLPSVVIDSATAKPPSRRLTSPRARSGRCGDGSRSNATASAKTALASGHVAGASHCSTIAPASASEDTEAAGASPSTAANHKDIDGLESTPATRRHARARRAVSDLAARAARPHRRSARPRSDRRRRSTPPHRVCRGTRGPGSPARSAACRCSDSR